MNARVILSIVFTGLGLIIAAIPESKTLHFRMSPEEMLVDMNGRSQYIGPDEVADLIIKSDPGIRLIDIRSSDEYNRFHLPGAVNVPMASLLDEEMRYLVDQDILVNILYSNSSVKANEAYMITRQLGYHNNYVLEGGLNYWAETIMNPTKPASTSPDEEMARYDFRRGAGMALGGGAIVEKNVKSSVSPPALVKRPKKKRAEGGC